MQPYNECADDEDMLLPGLPCPEGGSISVPNCPTPSGEKNVMVFFRPNAEARPGDGNLLSVRTAWNLCRPTIRAPVDLTAVALCIGQRYNATPYGPHRGIAVIPSSIQEGSIGLASISGHVAVNEAVLQDQTGYRLDMTYFMLPSSP